MNIVQWFFDLVYGGTAISFRSRLTIAESVSRLSAIVEPSLLGSLTRQCAVGTVKDDRVSIQRAIPFVGNSWKPFFIGSFKQVDGQTVLEGSFTMSPWVKGFMSVWFGFIGVWVVLAIVATLRNPSANWLFPLFGIVLFCAGAAMVRAGKWFARNDIAWLSRLIEGALEVHAAQPAVAADSHQRPSSAGSCG